MTSLMRTPGSLAEHLDVETPIAVGLIEAEHDLSDLQFRPAQPGRPYRSLLALVRVEKRPVGWLSLPLSADGRIPRDELADVSESLAEISTGPPAEVAPPNAGTPTLSVVVTTCANEDSIVRCVEKIGQSSRPPLEVIVVENRPQHSNVESALRERFGEDESIRYVEESNQGLSYSRNAGLREARGDIVAFTDDDVAVDPEWTQSLCEAFAADPELDCVTGLILPLELESPVQLLIERFASFGKGFVPRVYSLSAPPLNQPLFPYAAGHFGSGANMAFKVASIREIGGFDPVLGAGTPARGGEDLDICIRTLRKGMVLAYEPKALVWHRHHETPDKLRRQVFEYGVGLGAMLVKNLIFGPDRRAILVRAPRAVHYFRDPTSRKNVTRGMTFPKSLSRLERIGFLCGPFAYLASRIRGNR